MTAPIFFKVFLVTCLMVVMSFTSVVGDNQTEQPDSLTQFDSIINDNLIDFQKKMLKGLPDLNLTGFNPIIMGPRNFKEQNNMVAVSFDVKQINIFGLISFAYEMKKSGNSSITLDLSYPYLTARGLYTMTGKAFKAFPLIGEGSYEVKIQGAKMNLEGKFSEVNSKVIFEAGDLEFDYKTLTVRLENFGGGSSVSVLVKTILQAFGKDILTHIEPTMEARMKPVLNQMFYEILSKNEAQVLARNLFLK